MQLRALGDVVKSSWRCRYELLVTSLRTLGDVVGRSSELSIVEMCLGNLLGMFVGIECQHCRSFLSFFYDLI